ncbi:phosducin [Coccidioides posadasii str. Silveira]|uniref:Phosducin n=1 Tax=Coccidioides posadasii (strain RMSCC 757 / Silveira) TaxID=443226 RepID=E9D2J3_COCPS|nr:phosducin [Coccidioides posadasii str. Silveira]
MSAAQDEVNRLLNSQEDRATCHPEDRLKTEDLHSSPSEDEEEEVSRREKRTSRLKYIPSDSDADDSDYNMITSQPAAYHVPRTWFDANTGPKGVIADAQSYERAKKRSFRRTLMSAAGIDYQPSYNKPEAIHQEKASPSAPQTPEGSDDERFMREWREARMRELQNKNMRRSSPSKRRYGSVEVVGANGYLDAVERVTADTVVVVCIYDPELSESSIVEDCLNTVARKHATTRFVKLHHEIAEMDHIEAPALLAYRGGDVFATIVDIFRQLPDGRDCSSSSLEALLMQHRVL